MCDGFQDILLLFLFYSCIIRACVNDGNTSSKKGSFFNIKLLFPFPFYLSLNSPQKCLFVNRYDDDTRLKWKQQQIVEKRHLKRMWKLYIEKNFYSYKVEVKKLFTLKHTHTHTKSLFNFDWISRKSDFVWYWMQDFICAFESNHLDQRFINRVQTNSMIFQLCQACCKRKNRGECVREWKKYV